MEVRKSRAIAYGQWTDKQQLFLAWLGIPKDQRQPATMAELAAVLEVNPNTLTQWKKLPGLVDAANDIAYEMIREALPSVYANVVHHAAHGKDIEWVKLILAMAGKSAMVAGSNASLSVTGHMSEDEAEAIFARAGIDLKAKSDAKE